MEQTYITSSDSAKRPPQGDLAQAINHHQQALALLRQVGDRTREAEALNGLGEALRATGALEHAYEHHTAALTLAIQIPNRREQARAHNGLAHIDHAAGTRDSARMHWQQALARYVELGVPEADEVRAYLSSMPVPGLR